MQSVSFFQHFPTVGAIGLRSYPPNLVRGDSRKTNISIISPPFTKRRGPQSVATLTRGDQNAKIEKNNRKPGGGLKMVSGQIEVDLHDSATQICLFLRHYF